MALPERLAAPAASGRRAVTTPLPVAEGAIGLQLTACAAMSDSAAEQQSIDVKRRSTVKERHKSPDDELRLRTA